MIDLKYQREYMDWLAKELNIQKPEDWYSIDPSDIVARYGNINNKNLHKLT